MSDLATVLAGCAPATGELLGSRRAGCPGSSWRSARACVHTPRLEAVIETPRYDLTIFKIHFGRLTLKAYSKGEHVLRVEAVTHNTADLGCGRVLDRFPDIVTRLAAIADRFCTTLDCVDVAFVPDGLLDQLPTPSRLGATRMGGIDLNRPRLRHALSAALALAAAPTGFTVAEFTAKVHARQDRPTSTTAPARPPTTSENWRS